MKKYILLIIFLLSLSLTLLYYIFFLKDNIRMVKNTDDSSTMGGGEKEFNSEVENVLEDIENYNFMFLLYSEIGGYDLRKIENKPELLLIYNEAKKDENILNILKEKASNSKNIEFKEFVDLIEYNLNLEK